MATCPACMAARPHLEGLPAPLKEEQNPLLMSGGWLGPRVTVTQWARAPDASGVQFRLQTYTSSGQRIMHSYRAVGLKGCIHQNRAPFTNSQARVLHASGRSSLESSVEKERCLGMGVSFPLMLVPCAQFSRISF